MSMFSDSESLWESPFARWVNRISGASWLWSVIMLALTSGSAWIERQSLWIILTCGTVVGVATIFIAEKVQKRFSHRTSSALSILAGSSPFEWLPKVDFSTLMREGKAIADQISNLSGEQLAGWDSELESWKQRVTDFMDTAGWNTETVPFLQVGDKAEPVQGIGNLELKRERRRRRMALYNQKLDDIAQRRIASAH
jgi:hypothetical protein